VTEHSEGGSFFRSRKFTDFPTVKEALIAKELGATFILAPMAMQLAADGVPCKIVYLGHRDGTAIVVGKNSAIRDFADLRGKRIAVPSRYSNQNVLLHKMMKERGMPFDCMDIRELPPPEHPAALQAGSVDAYIVGEPFAALAEVKGFGRVLYLTKDIWPDFISCVLVVHQDWIDERRELVQELVDGIAKSGKWLDSDQEHRMEAAEVAGRLYYEQNPELLKYVLSKPPDRVRYTKLAPARDDFQEIVDLAVEMGILRDSLPFEAYADASFTDTGNGEWDMDSLPDMERVLATKATAR
jgi:NitT/TauT family transport system substrate-binding protein